MPNKFSVEFGSDIQLRIYLDCGKLIQVEVADRYFNVEKFYFLEKIGQDNV